jgi:hypothetical protein
MYFKDKDTTNIDSEFNNDSILSRIMIFISRYKLFFIIGVILLIILVVILLIGFNGIKVVDNTINYLVLNGDEVVTIYQGSDYIDPGYKAYNSKNENLNNDVKIGSDVNANVVGEYEISYILGDVVKTRKVIVVEKPKVYTFIKLNVVDNSINVYLKLGEVYNEPGYQVFSSTGKDLNDKVVVTGSVDTSKKGKYEIKYSLVDESGITISVSRLVTVMDTEISLSLNNSSYTNKDVGINVNVDDEFFDYMLLPDGSKINERKYIYMVSTNGKYTFKTYSTKGVVKEKSIEVNNINRTLPMGNCSGSFENGKSIININASDDIGIKRYEINGSSYSNNMVTINKELSTVTVKIYDKADNVKEISCNLKDNNKPIISDKNITFSYKYVTDENYMPYALYTPSTASDGKKIPLVIWLHGGGEFNSSEKTFKNSGFLKVLNEWKLDGFNAYVICPHVSGKWYSGLWVSDKTVNNLYSLLDKFIKENNVDKNKIILTGHSQGARGVLYVPSKRLDFFSALVVLSGFDAVNDISVLKHIPAKGYSEGYGYMKTTFVNTFGKENYMDIMTSHGDIPNKAFNLDVNKDNKSDLVEWMLNQELKK